MTRFERIYFNKFIKWFVDYAGKNYGYNIETSTKKKIPLSIINKIYQELYTQWGINDLNLSSHYCNTCHKHDKDYPYHFDVNIVTNVDSPNYIIFYFQICLHLPNIHFLQNQDYQHLLLC